MGFGKKSERLTKSTSSDAPPSKFLQRALKYANRGWRVTPLRPGDKKPYLKNWPSTASTDADTISEWWHKTPHANVGIVCGPRSGIFVLDIDVKNGSNGEASLKALERDHGKLPPTREQRTPTGGRHLFFKCDKSMAIKNAVKFRDGLDVRADDCGQVAMPPSHTEASEDCAEGDYTIINGGPIAAPPQWLIDVIKGGRDDREPAAFRLPTIIPDGERDITLFKYACKKRHEGCEYDQILLKLRKVNTKRCNPPLPDKEVVAKARAACKYPRGEVRDCPPPSDDTEQIDPEQYGRSLADIMQDKTLKTVWIVNGLLAENALPILAGSPKTGKTTFMMHLICMIKGLVPALGDYEAAKGTEHYPIGYFNEMGEVNIKKAVKDVKPDITDAEAAQLLKGIRIYGQWPVLDEKGLQQA